jgi:hypothetical protein
MPNVSKLKSIIAKRSRKLSTEKKLKELELLIGIVFEHFHNFQNLK